MSSPDKKKIRCDQSAVGVETKNLFDVSECGNNVASFLTFNERGRLLFINHQLNDEKWGIVKEKTYGCGPSGMSAVKAAKLIYRVARSEFGPARLLGFERSSHDAISRLWGNQNDNYDSYDISENLEVAPEKLKKFWSTRERCYDVSNIESGFSPKWKKRDRENFKRFFEKVNGLLSKLKTACDYLDDLETNATAFPDLYKYLVEEAGVEKAWLDRFAERRHCTWGKACFDADEEMLSYHVRKKNGTITFHSVDQLFPGQDTIRALPSKSYKPKPLHFRECIKCHEVRYDISYFECSYKHCGEVHKGKCANCAPTSTCASCGRSGCLCCFVSCSSEGCTHKMCNCSDFDGWKDSDRGGVPGCSFVVPNRDDDGGWMEQDECYCGVHKPEGAVQHETAVCIIM